MAESDRNDDLAGLLPCGVLLDEGFEDGGELLLLAARQLRRRFE